jgi:hypothetical protein
VEHLQFLTLQNFILPGDHMELILEQTRLEVPAQNGLWDLISVFLGIHPKVEVAILPVERSTKTGSCYLAPPDFHKKLTLQCLGNMKLSRQTVPSL